MSLKKQFEKACRTVANGIESGELKCGKFSMGKGEKQDEPHCAAGWVSAETGIHPKMANALFRHFGFDVVSITGPNDSGKKEKVVAQLRKIASKLHG